MIKNKKLSRRKIIKSSLLLFGSSLINLNPSIAKVSNSLKHATDIQIHFMNLAIQQAEEAIENGDWGPFGAVVVRNDELVSTGQIRVIRDKDPTAHAESIAIKEASKKLNTWNLSDCELYSTARCGSTGLGAMYWANISKVFYGFNYLEGMPFTRTDIEVSEQILNDPNKRLIPENQIDTKNKISKLLEKSFRLRYEELQDESPSEIGKI